MPKISQSLKPKPTAKASPSKDPEISSGPIPVEADRSERSSYQSRPYQTDAGLMNWKQSRLWKSFEILLPDQSSQISRKIDEISDVELQISRIRNPQVRSFAQGVSKSVAKSLSRIKERIAKRS